MKPLFLICVLLGLGRAMASDLDFTLVNQTARSFEGIYLSAASNQDWDGNLLPEGKVLEANSQLTVKFNAKEKSPLWDLNLVDADGLAVRFDDVKLSGADTVTLKTVDGKITAEIE